MATFHVVTVRQTVETYRVEAESEFEARTKILDAHADGVIDDNYKNIDFEEQSFYIDNAYDVADIIREYR